nr:hypothetical protein [uncultured Hyphomonas sp.]
MLRAPKSCFRMVAHPVGIGSASTHPTLVLGSKGTLALAIENIQFDTLGQLVFDSVPVESEKALLYAELEPGVALVSLFYESDGKVHYIDPRDELFDEVENLQDQLGADVRAFEFELVGERFKTAFTYRDQFDDKADDLGRRSVVLMKHFGHRREST